MDRYSPYSQSLMTEKNPFRYTYIYIYIYTETKHANFNRDVYVSYIGNEVLEKHLCFLCLHHLVFKIFTFAKPELPPEGRNLASRGRELEKNATYRMFNFC